MIAQAIGRWGNFFNQEAYGKAVESLNYLPAFIRDQMYIDGAYRQPTFLFESLWNLLGFGLVCVLRRRPKFLKQGEITAFYLVWYGCGRLLIEGLRTDSLMFLRNTCFTMAIWGVNPRWYYHGCVAEKKVFYSILSTLKEKI